MRFIEAPLLGALFCHCKRSADGWEKSYCRECGSHLYTTNPERPREVSIRMGALDGDPGTRPSAHQFTAYAAPWLPIPDDSLPRCPGLPAGLQPPDHDA